jgi:hypothetical protein
VTLTAAPVFQGDFEEKWEEKCLGKFMSNSMCFIIFGILQHFTPKTLEIVFQNFPGVIPGNPNRRSRAFGVRFAPQKIKVYGYDTVPFIMKKFPKSIVMASILTFSIC